MPATRRDLVLAFLLLLAAASSDLSAQAITGLSASEVPRSGYIEILGTGFDATGQLLINGWDAIVTDWGTNRILAYIPESAPLGPVPIQVVNSAGASNIVTTSVTQRQPGGRLRWSFRMSAPYSKVKPALGRDGTLYIVDVYGHLYAVSPEGALRWAVNDAGNKGVGVGGDGTVYTASDYVVRAYTPWGGLLWTYDIEPPGFVSVALEVGPDGNVYVLASQGPGIFSLSPDGELLWVDPEPYGRPTVPYPEIVFGPADLETQLYFYANGHVPAIGVDGGLRSCDIWDAYRSPVAVGPDGSIHMVNHAWTPDCELLWEFDLGVNRPNNTGTGPGPSVGPDGVHYMIVNGIQFYAIRSDGSRRWHKTLPEPLLAPSVDPTNSQILFGSSNTGLQAGYVASRSTINGNELWRHTFAPVESFNHFVDTRPRFTADGTVAYVSTWHGTENVYENASFFHALDITPDGDCAVPAEIQAVGFHSLASKLEWDPGEAGAEYDVVSGDLLDLWTGAEPACLASSLGENWLSGQEAPPAGQVRYYVVRGRNACGSGSWGRNSDGSRREYGACPP